MNFTQGVDPVSVVFTAKRGFVFRAKVYFFEDEAHTVALDLTGLNPSLEMEGYLTLTPGDGLVVDAEAGCVEIVLTGEQTEQAPSAIHGFTFSLEEGSGEAVPPIDGNFTFSKRIGA